MSKKYVIIVPDGMADYPIGELGGKTPMQYAQKPMMDYLASRSRVYGCVNNVPVGMVPESDTANLSILGYDPKIYSKGRSPLEALSMGVAMKSGDVAFRCNLVHISEDEDIYADKKMIDHSSDEISTKEADVLIKAIHEAFGTETRHFHTGVSYRHLMIWNNPPAISDSLVYDFMRPHDILGKTIREYLPAGEVGEIYLELMEKSYEVLVNHPINEARKKEGKRTANSIWFWSPGTKPALPEFTKKTELKGSVISAVDLIKGIGICAGMRSIDVDGATGNVDSNFTGKADAAIEAFKSGDDLVFLHMEAPDECGHRAELDKKVLSIELIDREVVKPVFDYLNSCREPFAVLALPDHPTPLELRTHSMEAVPFFIYDSECICEDKQICFDEVSSLKTGVLIPHGHSLIDLLIK